MTFVRPVVIETNVAGRLRIVGSVREAAECLVAGWPQKGPVLAYIAERQKELDLSRSQKAPRRRGQLTDALDRESIAGLARGHGSTRLIQDQRLG